MANVKKARVKDNKITFTNAMTGETEERFVRFTMGSLACIEEEVGSIDQFLNKNADEGSEFKLKDALLLIYAGLQHYDDINSSKDVGNILEMSDMSSVMNVVNKQLIASMPTATVDEQQKN